MEIIKNLLIGVYVIVCGALIILALIQTKDGASETIMGGGSSNFYEKNKGKTREGIMKKWTVILAAAFALLSITLGILIYAVPSKDKNEVDEENYVNEVIDENNSSEYNEENNKVDINKETWYNTSVWGEISCLEVKN